MLLAVVSLKCRRPRVTLVILPPGRLTLQNHYLVFHILQKSSWRRGTCCSGLGPWSLRWYQRFKLGESQNIKPKHTLLKCSVILLTTSSHGENRNWFHLDQSVWTPPAGDLPDRVEGSLAAVGLRLFDGHLAA